MILIVLMYTLFAVSFSLGKILVQSYGSPIFLTGIRMFTGGSILLAYQYFVARHHFKFKWKHRWLYLQMIIFGIYIAYILRFWGLQYVSAAKTSFLYNISPFLSSLYSYIIFNERLSRNQWIGLFIGFIGLLLILISQTNGTALSNWNFFIDPAELVILTSVACHSYSWIVMRKLVRDKSYAPMMVNGLAMTAGGILALITSLLVENTPVINSDNILNFGSLLAGVVIISNIFCYNLYGYLLKQYTATLLSFAGFLTPPLTALISWIFMCETITWHFYAANMVVLIGLYIFYKGEFLNKKDSDKIQPNVYED